MTAGEKAPNATIDLRLGPWRTALRGVRCDSLITDPPFSRRTHAGFRSGNAPTQEVGLGYECIDRTYVRRFVKSWTPRVRHWFVVFGDHITNAWWLDALEHAGFYTFAPVVWMKPDAAPRFTGDGPASQCEYLAVARRRCNVPKRSRRGYYEMSGVRGGAETFAIGQKPIDLMRAIVRDYSELDDLVCDPHAGSASTLLAAAIEGRRAVGSECDDPTFCHAMARVARGYTPAMFPAHRPRLVQAQMFAESDE